ncbi:MAG: SOS response-associated peptidase [Bacteroidota bacterium]|nr:SOS response-associated peptidase [Bacteroidota bacterium]
MCFHNSIKAKAPVIAKRYKAKFINPEFFDPIFHGSGFNYSKWPVITNDKAEVIQLFNWGLIPKWTKSIEDAAKIRSCTLNAKSETVFEKPSFRSSIKTNRCIIPSTGFFEWKTINKKKHPYFIFPKNEDFFSFAGIWEEWADKTTGEIINTFSILTTQANPLMATIHNEKKRMPLILPHELENNWLSENLTIEETKAFFVPYDEAKMQAHSISKLITSRTENSNVSEVQQEYKE